MRLSQTGAAGSIVLVLMSAFCLYGCGGSKGPPRAEISGNVTFDGAPVENGVIRFVAENGPSTGGVIENGVYKISQEEGVLLGKNTVSISWNKKTGKQIPLGSPAPPGTMVDEHKEVIPDKYNTRTTLTVEVKDGVNKEDFVLTK